MHRRDCYRVVAVRKAAACSVALGLLLAAVSRADEKTWSLPDSLAAGTCQQVNVKMDVTGTLRVMNQGKPEDLKLTVVANHKYAETVLARAKARQTARWYETADADLTIAGEKVKPTLRPEQRLVMVEASPQQRDIFSPAEMLTREELDLLDLQANTALLPLLLPMDAVAIGSTWQPEGDLLAQLLNVDVVSTSDVKCVLGDVAESQTANILIAGQVNGAVGGVATELHIDGTITYSLADKWITRAKLTVREQRAIGHVGPGLDVTCKLDVQIKPITTADLPRELTAPVEAPSEIKKRQLAFIAPGNTFRFAHDRRWHVMHESPQLVSLRLVDKGELVAQCNLSPLTPVAPDKVQSLDTFKENVKKSLGESFGRFTSERETTNAAGHRLIRLEAVGSVQGLEVEWHYFLVSDDKGHQVAAGVTLEQSLRERLGTLDGEMIQTVQLLVPSDSPDKTPQPVQAAQRPTESAK